MTHLLQIHIGPVQEFIASARRSRDLWYGSWLLSELSKAAARALVDHEGSSDALIFPAPKKVGDLDSGSSFNVANRVVAEIAGPPKDAAETARDAVKRRLDELRDEAFLDEARNVLATWDLAKKQIDDFHEFYWTAVPLSGAYDDARELADYLLAARKNTRDFSQIPDVAARTGRPKSALDGARESVIPEGLLDNADEMYRLFRAKPRERLSGVDLLKRLGRKDGEEHFPSTSHMAALPLRARLQAVVDGDNQEARLAWPSYLRTLPKAALDQQVTHSGLTLPLLDDYDGSLLFTSRLLDYLPRDETGEAAEALDRFYKLSGLPRPDPYYALLVGDGDFMGRTINDMSDPAENRAFSGVLAGFADKARTIVTEHDGAPIFTGGDDVLALLPVHMALPCSAALATAFRALMVENAIGGADPPTFSAGLAIVHHLEPLEDALNLAREAEKEAKRFPRDAPVPRKNALAVTLARRSGVPRTVVGHWGDLDQRLLKLAALHQRGRIPDGLAYQLQRTYLELGGAEAVRHDQRLQEIAALEAKRIIGRKREASGAQPLDDKSKDYLLAAVTDSHATAVAAPAQLIIASHIAGVCTLAGTTLDFDAPPAGDET